MASFTDNISALSNFNGYIQQYPVEAAVNVGMIKEQQFQQGLAKTQSYVDTLYSLPIDKDDVKQYVSAKVNQLRTGIKNSIAGDFSDQRLVNQIGGFVKQIHSDPIIQNGIASSASIRAGQAQIELDRKEGKLQPQNEWDFQTQANKYLSDKDIKSSFSYKYTPYSDYKKKALDTLKSMSGDETITDDAFTVDSSGNIQITDAITREKLKNLSPEKVRTALLSVFTPGDLQQIGIDGRYSYSNKSPQELFDGIQNNSNSTIEFYADKINILSAKLSATNSITEKEAIQNKISDYDKAIKSVKDRATTYGDMLDKGNFDGVAGQLYSDTFFDTFSKAFSYTETSKTYETSPFATMQFNRDKEINDQRRFELGLENTNFWKRLEYDQKEKELDLKKKELGGYGAVPSPIDPNKAYTPTMDQFKSKVDEDLASIQVDKNNLFVAQKATGGLVTDDASLNKARELWLKGQLSDPALKQYFDSESEKLDNITTVNKVIKDVEEDIRIKNPKLANISEISKPIQGVSYGVKNPDGSINWTTYSAKDIAEFNNSIDNYRTMTSLPSGGFSSGAPMESWNDNKARAELSPKEYKLYEIFKKGSTQGNLTQAEKQVFDKLREVNKAVNFPYGKDLETIADLQKEELSKRLSTTQGLETQFPTGKTEQRDAVRGVFQGYINRGQFPSGAKVDMDDAADLLKDNSTTYSINTVRGTRYTEPVTRLTMSNGDKTVSFDISETDRATTFGNFAEGTLADRQFQGIQERINLTGGYTTNSSKGDPKFSMFKQNSFPNVSLYGITADVEQSPTGYIINFNYYDPVRKKWITDKYTPTGAPMLKEQVVSALANISDEFIYNRINDNQPLTQEAANQLKEAKKDNY